MNNEMENNFQNKELDHRLHQMRQTFYFMKNSKKQSGEDHFTTGKKIEIIVSEI